MLGHFVKETSEEVNIDTACFLQVLPSLTERPMYSLELEVVQLMDLFTFKFNHDFNIPLRL